MSDDSPMSAAATAAPRPASMLIMTRPRDWAEPSRAILWPALQLEAARRMGVRHDRA